MEAVTIKHCREYLTNVTPIILSLEEVGKTAAEVKIWFEENNPDNTILVDLYYKAQKMGFPNPMTVPNSRHSSLVMVK